MDDFEKRLATHLRQIAEQVKKWERRDIREAIERDEQSLRRLAYGDDLEMIAEMLEGTQSGHRLTRSAPGKGRPQADNFDRDVRIAKLIESHRSQEDGSVGAGIDAAITKFAVSEGTAKAAWSSLRKFVQAEPSSQSLLLGFERMRRKGQVKLTRHGPPKK